MSMTITRAKKSGAPRGVTMLELTVAVAIGSVMFLIIGMIFLAQGQYFAIEDAIAETQVNAFQALDAAGELIPTAYRVVGSRTINGVAYATSDSLAIVQLPGIDSNGAVLTTIWDYAAVGQDPSDASKFIVNIEAGAGSVRTSGKYVKALLVDKAIFRYNNASTTSATAIDVYVRMRKDARGREITTPFGKIYYLASS